MSAAPPGRSEVAANTVRDTKAGLLWQRAVDANSYSWTDARAYCTTLSLEGTGWRLPTRKELQTLFDELSHPHIDSGAFPNTPLASFWTSSSVATSTTRAWLVDFEEAGPPLARPQHDDVGQSYRVRCVR